MRRAVKTHYCGDSPICRTQSFRRANCSRADRLIRIALAMRAFSAMAAKTGESGSKSLMREEASEAGICPLPFRATMPPITSTPRRPLQISAGAVAAVYRGISQKTSSPQHRFRCPQRLGKSRGRPNPRLRWFGEDRLAPGGKVWSAGHKEVRQNTVAIRQEFATRPVSDSLKTSRRCRKFC